MALDDTIGMCDLCGKEADANFEVCHALFCTANCHREQGDLYHADCLKKFISSGSKGTARHLPSIPYTNFLCPKGKGRGSRPDVPCKGLAHHCKRVIVKSEPKAPPPQPVVVEKRPKGLPKPKPPGPPKPAKPKAPPMSDFNPRATRLPPVPTEPKADPLGRNLNGTPQAELPPGFVDEGAEAKARQGKAAKKNQKKRAKRTNTEQEGWDAASANGRHADPHAAADGVQGWDSAAASSAAGDAAGAESSSAGGGRFITSISAFNALLSKHLDMSDDSEYDYESDDGSVSTAHRSDATPIPRWDHDRPPPQQLQQQQLQQEDSGDATGWQAVDAKGRALPPAVPPAGAGGGASAAQPAAEDPAELRRREEQLLKEALEASMFDAGPDAAGAGVAPPPAMDEEALLARAMAESLAAEQAQQQREMQEQAELLARFEAQRLQQQGTQPHGMGVGQHGGGWSAPSPTDADADAWGSAGSTDSAATSWAQSQQAVSPYQQSAQQQTAYLPNPYAAAPAAAAPAPAPAPQASPYITYQLPQPVYAASATPAPLAAPMSAPYAAPAAAPAPPAAYQPVALQQQQQAADLQQQMPWLQPAAASSTAALGGYAGTGVGGYAGAGGYPGVGGDYKAAPAAAAAAAADDDDDDLDSLLALLNV